MEDKHSTDFEPPAPPYSLWVCMSIHPEGESCSDLGRVLVLNDPPVLTVGLLRASTPPTSDLLLLLRALGVSV
jgi:hypothetical protein